MNVSNGITIQVMKERMNLKLRQGKGKCISIIIGGSIWELAKSKDVN